MANKLVRYARPVFSIVLVALWIGCGGPPRADQPMSTGTINAHLTRMAGPLDPADMVERARRTRYAADRLRDAGLQPVTVGSFLLSHGRTGAVLTEGVVDPAMAHVVGYVAGRNPNHSSRLVLLTGDLASPAGAAALEVVRLLAQEARFAIVPEATVGIALWSTPRTGALGPSDFLRNSPWALEAIDRVLVLQADFADHDAVRVAWAEAGIPVEVIAMPAGTSLLEEGRPEAIQLARTYQLAETTLARVREASAKPPAAVALDSDHADSR